MRKFTTNHNRYNYEIIFSVQPGVLSAEEAREPFAWYLNQIRLMRNSYAKRNYRAGLLTFIGKVTANQRAYRDQDGIELLINDNGEDLNDYKVEATSYGDMIDIGSGNLDFEPHPIVKTTLIKIITEKKEVFRYPSSRGCPAFGSAVADYFKHLFDVDLEPTFILPYCGTFHGIQALINTFLEPDDQIVVPQPGFAPMYCIALLHSFQPVTVSLDENGLIDLEHLVSILKNSSRVKMLYMNYPSNPIGAVAPLSFFQEVVKIARKYKVMVVNDMEDMFMSHTKNRITSFLEASHAMDVGVEFHTFSKGYGMAGLRLGFVAGNKSIIEGLKKFNGASFTMVPPMVQYAGITALAHPPLHNRKAVNERMKLALTLLRGMGWDMAHPKYGYNIWLPIPDRFENGKEFSDYSLRKCEVGVCPGEAFGQGGERFVRLTMQNKTELMKQAFARWKNFGIRKDMTLS